MQSTLTARKARVTAIKAHFEDIGTHPAKVLQATKLLTTINKALARLNQLQGKFSNLY